MASSKSITLSVPRGGAIAADAAKALEKAYIYWAESYAHGQRSGHRFGFNYRPRGFWKNLERGAVSCLTLFPSTTKVQETINWDMEPISISVAEAIEGDWHAVGKDLYSAIVKDRIETHNCGQYSFSFESESEPESAVTAPR